LPEERAVVPLLRAGSVVELDEKVAVSSRAMSDETRTSTAREEEPPPPEGPLSWVLHVVHPPDRGRSGHRYALRPDERLVLGRHSAELGEGSLQDEDVSREHVVLCSTASHLVLEIRGKNGLLVNGVRHRRTGPNARPPVLALQDGAVLSFPRRSGEPVHLLVRRTLTEVPPLAHPNILGVSGEIHRLLRSVYYAATTDDIALVRGETGSGKELVARAIHDASRRAGRPYSTVNCAVLHTETLQSELFGHTRGAFTGAVGERAGMVEASDGGTLFLDEIAELGADVQSRLLRFLDSGEVQRLGSDRVRRFDVRLICASGADFEELVRKDTFRRDLYFRLQGAAVVTVPPLRRRREDIPVLAYALVRELDPAGERRIDHRLMLELLLHPWPGNVRELRSVVRRAFRETAPGKPLTLTAEIAEHLAQSCRIDEPPAAAWTRQAAREATHADQRSARPALADLERWMIENDGKVSVVAKKSGVPRSTLYRWLGGEGGVLKRHRPPRS
jgi:DNA-binding NtrC family response regulator